MTPRERREPAIIDVSRRTRIARGAGVPTSAVSQLLKQFSEMRKMMRSVASGGPPGGAARAMARAAPDVPPGFEALAAGMRDAAPRAGAKGKKKKGGRVTPPKPR